MNSLARLLFVVLLSVAAFAQEAGKIFVVRHAERQSSASDSPLSDKGMNRAQCLGQTLKDAHIRSVFTTHFVRTKQTAAPLVDIAHAKSNVVDGDKEIARQSVAAAKEGNVLIVGHSNTVPNILHDIGTPAVTVPDDVFDQLFIVDTANPKNLLVLHYCPNLPKNTGPNMMKPK